MKPLGQCLRKLPIGSVQHLITYRYHNKKLKIEITGT